jgi:hypothetical protein
MSGYLENLIYDTSFKKLKKLKKLLIRECYQIQLTDELFKYLPSNLIELDISYCNQFTDKAFQYFGKNLEILTMCECSQETITDKAFSYLKNIKYLKMDNCTQKTITNKFLELIGDKLLFLSILECSKIKLNLNDLKKLKKLKKFNLDESNVIDGIDVVNVLKNCYITLI